jgi:hypothetical protein
MLARLLIGSPETVLSARVLGVEMIARLCRIEITYVWLNDRAFVVAQAVLYLRHYSKPHQCLPGYL